VAVIAPAAIVNVFGDLWRNGREPEFAAALGDGAVRLHLYGKPGPRPARKMGHLSAVGSSPLDALARARAAAGGIGAATEDVPDSVRRLIE
jgi:5-(carboxyamino)imidazole ribonucleotide synthase